MNLIHQYSAPDLTAAYGVHAEILFDAALPKFGFMPVDEHTTTYRGKSWTKLTRLGCQGSAAISAVALLNAPPLRYGCSAAGSFC